MIKLERPKYSGNPPAKKVRAELKRIRSIVNGGHRTKSKDFKSKLYRNDDSCKLYIEAQYGKCAYCEQRRPTRSEGDIEHFRPKTSVKECPEHGGYWWLAYSWKNLFWSCKECNQARKRDRFPLVVESKRASKPNDRLTDESPVTINPFEEDPEEILIYEATGARHVFANVRAQHRDRYDGIDVLGLNRDTLAEDRMRMRKQILLTLHLLGKAELDPLVVPKAMEKLKELVRDEATFAGMVRYLARQFGFEDQVQQCLSAA